MLIRLQRAIEYIYPTIESINLPDFKVHKENGIEKTHHEIYLEKDKAYAQSPLWHKSYEYLHVLSIPKIQVDIHTLKHSLQLNPSKKNQEKIQNHIIKPLYKDLLNAETLKINNTHHPSVAHVIENMQVVEDTDFKKIVDEQKTQKENNGRGVVDLYYILVYMKHIKDYLQMKSIPPQQWEEYKVKHIKPFESIQGEIYKHRNYPSAICIGKNKNIKKDEGVFNLQFEYYPEYVIIRNKIQKSLLDIVQYIKNLGIKKLYLNLIIKGNENSEIQNHIKVKGMHEQFLIGNLITNPKNYPIANITITGKNDPFTLLKNKIIHGYLDIVDYEGDVNVHNLTFTGEKLFGKNGLVLEKNQWARVRESFRRLKVLYDERKNFIEGNKMYAMELRARAKEIAMPKPIIRSKACIIPWLSPEIRAWLSQYFSEWAILQVQNRTSKHSQSWVRVLLWMLGIAFICSVIITEPWQWKAFTIESFWHHLARLLLSVPRLHEHMGNITPAHITTDTNNLTTWWKQAVIFIGIILEVYLIYQLRRAFRFFTKR